MGYLRPPAPHLSVQFDAELQELSQIRKKKIQQKIPNN